MYRLCYRHGNKSGAQGVAVKVIGGDGHGTVSEFIAGVDFVIRRHLELRRVQEASHRGSVATMSIGYERSRTMDTVVKAAVDAGIHVAVAAGNDGADYCEIQSPRVEGTFKVGASTVEDERAEWSNYGPCVDIFAPGRTVLSTWTGNDTATEIGLQWQLLILRGFWRTIWPFNPCRLLGSMRDLLHPRNSSVWFFPRLLVVL
ncbi:serine protease [Linnemannia schmuckeri]|uniref:Serine protease n=1 Tax=Linnemannia schmuckeri TaxID=64567 RepID=A0A9P5V4E3_9FUNG|nr:serine protease [Linnemannia schmuckeri]